MSDIIFTCWKCTKSLSIPAEAAGHAVPCPDCETHLTIPSPSFDFRCESCAEEFSSSEEYEGISVYCPSCDEDLTVFKNPSATA